MKQPNLLVIFSDQQHGQALGRIDPWFRTPHLDQFAEDALRFQRCFCTTPQCSPSRSSMLTGLYPHRTGVANNVGMLGGEPLRKETVGPMLQRAGYTTSWFGKWHLGDEAVATGGWNETLGISQPSGGDQRVTEAACDFLRQQPRRHKPWAMFVSINDPHDVYRFQQTSPSADERDVPLPPSWYNKNFAAVPGVHEQFMTEDQGKVIHHCEAEDWRHYRRVYRDKVERFDACADAVLTQLASSGLDNETVVIITSDHGDMDAHQRLIFKGPFMYEQMVRVPLMMRVPAAFGGGGPGDVDDFDAVLTDLTPTLLDFAGAEPIHCDGLSWRGLLPGNDRPHRPFVIGQYHGKQKWVNPARMIRTSRFKFVRYIRHGEELYDLVNDPHEQHNRAGDPAYAEARHDLASRLDVWMRFNDDPFYSLTPTDREGRPLAPAMT